MAVAAPGAHAPFDTGEWRKYWTVMLPAFFGIMMVSAHGNVTGVMIRPIEAEFGWPRAQISAGLSMMAVVAVLFSPFAGAAVDRFGARRMALLGVPAYCGGFAAFSLVNENATSWFAVFGLLAFANLMVMPVTWLSLINMHYRRNQGLALAVALTGTGLGGAIFPFVVNALIEAFGWRSAYVIFAGIVFAVVYPATLLFFRRTGDRREDAETAPDGAIGEAIETAIADESAVAATPASAAPVPPKRDLRKRMASVRFVKLALAAVIFSLAGSAITTNVVPILIAEGLTASGAAATAGLLGIGAIAGRLLGGYLLDRIDGNKVAAVSSLIPVVAMVILLSAQDSVLGATMACLVFGFSLGTELDACAYLAARHFGALYFGALFGSINGLLIFGHGIAPLFANAIFDATQSYDLVLMGVIPMFVLIAGLFLSLGDYRNLDPQTGEPLAPA